MRESPRKVRKLTQEDKDKIYRMFFGPIKKEWRTETGIVDNSDETIAKRLNLATPNVSRYIAIIEEEHFKWVTEYHNEKRSK